MMKTEQMAWDRESHCLLAMRRTYVTKTIFRSVASDKGEIGSKVVLDFSP